ncbi:MAG TPA: exodeoxyribonuclease VII large subunit [Spirochaetota bacterium]|nr:exodeoxyribonuclease VII large subunit [Spirochaetota bacterium]
MQNSTNSQYLSVSDLTHLIKLNLESVFYDIYLKGEVSNFRPSSNGHWYFSLKDNNSSIKAIIFKNNQQEILKQLKSNNQDFENGKEVLVEGRLSVYEKSGEYSIIINKVIPIGVGELTLRFQLLKEKLSSEGLFDENKKKSLPKYPEVIGIVTSPTGAALQDILNVLKRRFATIKIIVFPCSVQGESAKYEISKAIECANYHYKINSDKKVDTLLIARGGGSIEDLWAFNEEIVARSIFNSTIPTITGIGHEIDFTIADFCADLRAPTPSAAAEIVVKNKEDLVNSISSYKLRIEAGFNNYIEKIFSRFERCENERLTTLFERIYEEKNLNYSYSNDKFTNFFKNSYENSKKRFIKIAEKLNNLSPLSVLSRGYSLVTDVEGNVIKSSKDLKKDETLYIKLNSGKIKAGIIDIIE